MRLREIQEKDIEEKVVGELEAFFETGQCRSHEEIVQADQQNTTAHI